LHCAKDITYPELAKQAFDESAPLRNENSKMREQRFERINERNHNSEAPR